MDDIGVISKIGELLREYNSSYKWLIAESVASVCDVDKEEMLSGNRDIHNTHARYLYWYALKYLTHDSNLVIGETSIPNKIYTTDCVRKGINSILNLIDKNTQWNKRWQIVKNIISTIKKDIETERTIKKVVISVPEGIEVEIKKL